MAAESTREGTLPPRLVPPRLVPPRLVPPRLVPPRLVPPRLVPPRLVPPRLLAPTHQWHRSFCGRCAELRQVRRWLAGLLPASPASDDVMAIAVELATNAVRHTSTGRGGRFTVAVSWRDHTDVLRISVTDDGAPQGPRWPTGPCPVRESGIGLHLVCALASRTGECGDASSRQVWAEVPWDAGLPPRD